MILGSVATVVAFFVFITPGLTWELLREQKYPAASTSAFREWARVALLSTAFSAASVGILILARLRFPSVLPDPEDWLKPHSNYARVHYRTVAATVAAEVVLACIIAAAHHFWVTRGQHRLVRPGPLRNVVLYEGLPPRGPVIRTAAVRMKNGTTYMGTLALVGHEDSRADAELALAPPLWRGAPGGQPVPLGEDWQRVVLPFAEIVEMLLSWRPDQPSTAT